MAFLLFIGVLVLFGIGFLVIYGQITSDSDGNSYNSSNCGYPKKKQNKSSSFTSSFYRDLDRGEYDDDPDILREEDPEMYGEFFDD